MTLKTRLARIEDSGSPFATEYARDARTAVAEGDHASAYEYIEIAEEILKTEGAGFDQEQYLDS